MKRTFILSAVLILTASLVFTSCHPSRVWATKKKEPRTYREQAPPPPPRYVSTVALVITPSPGFVMKQNPNGRFYHRSEQGYLYWKGVDNRFYLDRSYLNRVSYDRWEYNEWKRYSRESR
jgi:hypothetical protein